MFIFKQTICFTRGLHKITMHGDRELPTPVLEHQMNPLKRTVNAYLNCPPTPFTIFKGGPRYAY